jgi:trk system potassium uptake protein TrkA
MLALYCNCHKISNIVTKLDRIENASMLDSLPIGSIVRPKELASNEIVRYVRAMHNQTGAAITVHSIADGMAEALEFNVTESTRHIGQPLKKIKLREHVLIACITNGSCTEIPDGESVFNPGDSIIIVTDGNLIVRQINDIFQ